MKDKTRTVFIIKESAKKAPALYVFPEHRDWQRVHHAERETYRPIEYLEGDEEPLQRSKCRLAKGIPAQSAPPFCQNILRF